VRFLNSITAKVIVWLAAVLVPAETLPRMVCACGNHAPGPSQAAVGCAGAGSVAACPHCNVAERSPHSCCGSSAASHARSDCCAAQGACSCCCTSGAHSDGTSCQCARDDSAPAPAPLPGDSRTDTTKSSVSVSSFTGPTAVVLPVPSADARADQHPAFLGSSAPERLSVLCRLVI
jgi:hypothetical protein